MTTVIRATSAADVLGLVPSVLGFTPTESLVFMPFVGKRSQGVMRFDLPEPENMGQCVEQAVGYLLRVPDVDGALVIVYTAQTDQAALLALAEAQSALHSAGIYVVDLLYVAGDQWGSPTEGPFLVSEILPNPDAPDFLVGDQATGAELPVVDKQRARVIKEQVRNAGELDPFASIIGLMTYAADEELTPPMLGDLHYMLARPALRDILLVAWATDSDVGLAAMNAQLDWEEGAEYPRDLAKIIWGEADRQPDPARLLQALENVRMLLAVAPSPGVYATAAWLSWALGRSTHADRYAQAGLELDPEHGLCKIVQEFIAYGHLPGWAFTPKGRS